MKKLSLFIIVALTLTLVMGFTSIGLAQEFKVGMVTDVGGLGDESFNDSAWRGLQRAEEDFDVEINVIESNTMTDYTPNLSSLAEQGYDMVWGIGYLFTDSMEEVASMYPDVKFGIVDAVVEGPNVVSVTFDEHTGSFLAGVVAGMRTETDEVGYIGGMESTLIKKFEAGYRAGVKAVNPDAEISIAYTGSFDDPQAGKELAFTQFDQGADVIYHASGACGIGVIKAANERGLYAIGVDSPQNHLAPSNVLTSMIKKVDNSVYNEVKKLVNDNFETGVQSYGLESEGVGIYRPQAENMLSQEIIDTVDEYRQKIIDGEVEVPEHPDDL
ncbi:MAG: BMP family ABC transporter substrate-binding protein [Halanaerobiales bacterium]